MRNFKYPMIVIEGLDVILFDSKEDLIMGLEGIDVAENIYKSFDAEGREIRLRAVGAKRGLFIVNIGRVEIDSIEEEPTHHEELYSLLTSFLHAIGKEINNSMMLSELVDACKKALTRSKWMPSNNRLELTAALRENVRPRSSA